MTWISPPGASISDALEELGISVQEFSVAVKMTVEQVKNLIAGKVLIDEALAERISEVVGSTPAFWLRREMNYRISLQAGMESEQSSIVKEVDYANSVSGLRDHCMVLSVDIKNLHGAIHDIKKAYDSRMYAAPELQEETETRLRKAIEYASSLR